MAAAADFSTVVTPEGLRAFLSSKYIKGIGKVFAGKIADRFGMEVLHPGFDWDAGLGSITGLGEAKRLEAVASISALPLPAPEMAMLFSSGLRESDIAKIIAHYRKKTFQVVSSDPYEMVENVWKLSFFTADKLGKLLGITSDDPRRLRGALLTAIKIYAERGSMYATEDQAVKTAAQISGVEEEAVRSQLPSLIADERIIKSSDGFYLPVYYNAEREAAEKLGRFISRTPESEPEFELPSTDIYGHPFSRRQRQAIKTVAESPVSIVTGGPGTGKTTVIRGLMRLFDDMDKKVVLVAPTGRAAKRITDLSGYEASTIHRLLGYRMGRGYSHKNFDADVLIVDEASMLEQVLFNHLLQSMKPDAKIVLVGDTNQLPPIGAGDVLNQMIRSGAVPVVELDKNFRQDEGSGIAVSASEIKLGRTPGEKETGDFLTIEAQGVKNTRDKIISLVGSELPRLYGVAPKDIQIVTPQQEGPLGAKQLNEQLQDFINPHAPEITKGKKRLRLGDRVMQKTNDSARKVFNGETGWVSAVDEEAGTLEVTFFDGKKLEYDRSRLGDLVLSYATTVHKLQGSETDYMVLLMSMAHRPMLYRNLLYTGVSRARRLCVVLGEREALEKAVGNHEEATRNSAFSSMLLSTIASTPK